MPALLGLEKEGPLEEGVEGRVVSGA